jgi:long-chain acyl-CoA synthetase
MVGQLLLAAPLRRTMVGFDGAALVSTRGRGKDPPVDLDIPALLTRWASERPDSPAFTDTVVTRTWREIDERTRLLAGVLESRGIGPGDRVGYLGRNSIEYYEVQFALTRLGAVMVPLNWRLTAEEIDYLVADAGASVVVADEEFLPLVPSCASVILTGSEYECELHNAGRAPDRPSALDEVIIHSYTSGTTSMPKGVLLTNRNIQQTLRHHRVFEMGEDTVVLAVMPNYHVGGSVFALFGLRLGVLCVVIRAFDPVDLPRRIEQYRVTHFNIAPTMGSMMADELGEDPPDLSSIRAVIYGGAPISIKEYERLSQFMGAPLVQMYGMTENSALSRLGGDEHVPELLRSVGRAVGGVEIEIRDPESGASVPAGVSGEVWVRSVGNTIGYWRRPEATESLFVDGWMRTGDGGRLDDNGYLFLTDRISDLIITGGENVYPAEVERVLITHPDVREVAVVGAAHPKWGDAVTAFVVPEPESTVDGRIIVEWSRGKLPGFRRPQAVHVIEELPRNAAGKVLRRVLRDTVSEVATPCVWMAEAGQQSSQAGR